MTLSLYSCKYRLHEICTLGSTCVEDHPPLLWTGIAPCFISRSKRIQLCRVWLLVAHGKCYWQNLIWQFSHQSPTHQIKVPAKFSRHTIVLFIFHKWYSDQISAFHNNEQKPGQLESEHNCTNISRFSQTTALKWIYLWRVLTIV